MRAYSNLLVHLLMQGTRRGDRTGVSTISIFDHKFVHDLSKGFPLLTGKKVPFTPVVAELLWFLMGSTNVDKLRELTFGIASKKNTIWDANYNNQGVSLGYTKGELGPVYGKQWRSFGVHERTEHGNLVSASKTVDQINKILEEARRNPESRRLLVSAWNPLDVDIMSLPPCHWAFELYIEEGKLNLKWHQRSVDVFLGLPFNIASYALLTHIFAKLLGLEPGILIGDLTNVHIYANHVDQVNTYLARELKELPTLVLPDFNSLDELFDPRFDVSSIRVEGYDPHPFIKAPMAV